MQRIILASNSPRRQQLFQQAGIPFVVMASAYEEKMDPGREPKELVLEFSEGKAYDVARRAREGIVVAADTVVAIDDVVLGKPTDTQDAFDTLKRLSGRWHKVHTGMTIMDAATLNAQSPHIYRHVETTGVHWRELSDQEIWRYIATREPKDKAGSYAIQGIAAKFIVGTNGCYNNVVGLPIARLYTILTEEFKLDI